MDAERFDMSFKNGWDPKAAVEGGVVTVRELTHATSAVLDELERQQEPVLITRHGKVIAVVVPATARDVFGGIMPTDNELQRRKDNAERALKEGLFSSSSDRLGARGLKT